VEPIIEGKVLIWSPHEHPAHAKCDEPRRGWSVWSRDELLARYERKDLPGDALAGVIVATLLIPQGMAYALLAGCLHSSGCMPAVATRGVCAARQ